MTNSEHEPNIYLKDIQIAERYQISRNSVWRWVREEGFPKPIKIVGSTRWLLSEINEWEQVQ